MTGLQKILFASEVEFRALAEAKFSTCPKTVGIESYRSEIVPRAPEGCFRALGTFGWAFRVDFLGPGSQNLISWGRSKSRFLGDRNLIGYLCEIFEVRGSGGFGDGLFRSWDSK